MKIDNSNKLFLAFKKQLENQDNQSTQQTHQNPNLNENYFKSVGLISNLNKAMINTHQKQNLAFKKEYVFYEEITEKDIPDDVNEDRDEITCGNITLHGSRHFEKITARPDMNSWGIMYPGDIKLFNRVYVNELNSDSEISLNDISRAVRINARKRINLNGQSYAYAVNSNIINLNDISKIAGDIILSGKNSQLNISSRDVYVNPFLIKSNDKNFHPNRIFLSREREDIASDRRILDKYGDPIPYMPKTVRFIEDYVFEKDYSPINVESEGALTFKDYSNAVNVKAKKNIVLKDNADIESINSKESCFINDNAKVDNVIAKYVELSGNAKVINSVNAQRVKVSDQAEANLIVLSPLNNGDISLEGNGTVRDIYVNGSEIVIKGPLRVGGEIKFINADNQGKVILKSDKNGEYAKINPGQLDNNCELVQRPSEEIS